MMHSLTISNKIIKHDDHDDNLINGNSFDSKTSINATKESSEWIYSDTCESRLNSRAVYDILCERFFDQIYSRKELRDMVIKECKPFRLPEDFVESYRDKRPPFGFGGLGEATFYRTYSRRIPCPGGEGVFRREAYYEVVKRVVEGCFSMQKRHIYANGDHWNDDIATKKAKDMYERMFLMKFTPPGRGLWAMGSKITEEEGLWGALNNCAFFSTENIGEEKSYPFAFLMDNSMIGIGVGMDVKGAGKLQLHMPSKEHGEVEFIIGDTREGWVSSTIALLESYFNPEMPVMRFDYSKIRPAGNPLITFGGIAPGPEPLKRLHKQLVDLLEGEINGHSLKSVIHDDEPTICTISERVIADIANMLGACVVSGNVRRSAEILFGPPESAEFMDLKDYEKNPERCEFGWISNNSIFATVGMDYGTFAERTWKNGEPGIMWLENARSQGRMTGLPEDMARKDPRIKGGNPCLEQSLENTEICNLCETMIDSHDSVEDFLRTLKCCVMYCKTVSLGTLHHKRSNAVMCNNRRYGVSLTGIKQFLARKSREELIDWCESGYKIVQYYDGVYASWFNIPRSIKTTSIKPSGSVSLLAGKTPGVHAPVKTTYVRRITVSLSDNVLGPLKEAGYPMVECPYDKGACLVEFPIKLDHGAAGGRMKTQDEESLIEQLEIAALLQRHWADNQVSVTIHFSQEKTSPEDIVKALDMYQYQLKGVSFMPAGPIAQYKNPPYEDISDEEYYDRASVLKPIDWSSITSPSVKGVVIKDVAQPRYCLNDSCEL
jgi:ribonucleoside-triphosphate reductase (thioredoxin)